MYKKICKKCGRDFFTEHEMEEYKRKHKNIPYLCKECYLELTNKRSNALDEISNQWKVEAKQENAKYFYYTEEVNQIVNGSKFFVIGRKGEGKTAIAEYIADTNSSNIFTEKMSFKNFPFNILYELSNGEYTVPNQYITIWKYIIYSCVCKMLIKNESINGDIRAKLEKMYGDSTPNKSLDRLIKKWTTKDFGFQILGNGINIGRDINEESPISWIDKTILLEDLIVENIDDSSYFILFDELDEDYKEFSNSKEKDVYVSLVTSLFKAVQDIRTLSLNNNIKVWPVVFLRQDIYSLIRDSDKNKWSDSIINIIWDELKIKQMLAHRLEIVTGEKGTFEELWKMIFSKNIISMGNKKASRMEIFPYITRSTQQRPRDYIKYLKECATLAIRYNKNIITPEIVREADGAFSEYLKAEIIDEIHVVLPEITDIFDIFSQIRKQTFSPKTFEKVYNEWVQKKGIPNRGAENVLIMLFDVNAIGNQPTMKGQTIFKYSAIGARFNYKENIMIHRGLFKSLQIF